MKTKSTIRYALLACLACLIAACNKTDEYYGVLVRQPELVKDYASVYALGDTIRMRGRFDPGSLKITIGDADARIIGTEADVRNPQMQHIEAVISEAMGVGTDRPVRITSAGITIEGPAIEIVEDAKSGVLPRELTVVELTDYLGNVNPVFCRSAAGNMYFLRNRILSIYRMDKDGKTADVFQTGLCQDEDGTPFAVTSINGAGIDPSETYLFLSAYTEATGGEAYHHYRLCRYNLKTGEFNVLNKTPYHKDDGTKRTLNDVTPFEGSVASVKMFAATGIYPDSKGNVFFTMGNWAITRLDADGNYSFRVKNSNGSSSDGIPEIFEPGNGAYLSRIRRTALLPGVRFSYIRIEALDPENEQFYVHSSITGLSSRMVLYDLKVNAMTGLFDKFLNIYTEYQPVHISGSFPVLSGFTTTPNSFFGVTPVGDGKMLLLYYQDHYYKDDPRIQMPAWGILDFIEKRGRRYAPGKFDPKGYVMNHGTDQVLTIDAEGMIYMTAKNRQVILKTVYK